MSQSYRMVGVNGSLHGPGTRLCWVEVQVLENLVQVLEILASEPEQVHVLLE